MHKETAACPSISPTYIHLLLCFWRHILQPWSNSSSLQVPLHASQDELRNLLPQTHFVLDFPPPHYLPSSRLGVGVGGLGAGCCCTRVLQILQQVVCRGALLRQSRPSVYLQLPCDFDLHRRYCTRILPRLEQAVS